MQFSEWAPAGIVDEFADMDNYCDREYSLEQELKSKGMPVMVCPNCNTDFYYLGEKKQKKAHTSLMKTSRCHFNTHSPREGIFLF